MNFLNLLSNGNLEKYTKSLIQKYAISPKKAWGQNFIIEKSVIDTLLSEVELNEEDTPKLFTLKRPPEEIVFHKKNV